VCVIYVFWAAVSALWAFLPSRLSSFYCILLFYMLLILSVSTNKIYILISIICPDKLSRSITIVRIYWRLPASVIKRCLQRDSDLVKSVSNYAVFHGCMKSGLGRSLVACRKMLICLYRFWFVVVRFSKALISKIVYIARFHLAIIVMYWQL